MFFLFTAAVLTACGGGGESHDEGHDDAATHVEAAMDDAAEEAEEAMEEVSEEVEATAEEVMEETATELTQPIGDAKVIKPGAKTEAEPEKELTKPIGDAKVIKKK